MGQGCHTLRSISDPVYPREANVFALQILLNYYKFLNLNLLSPYLMNMALVLKVTQSLVCQVTLYVLNSSTGYMCCILTYRMSENVIFNCNLYYILVDSIT